MIHDYALAREEAKRIANENGAPVWIERNRILGGSYVIHETPDNMPSWATIIEPDEEVTE